MTMEHSSHGAFTKPVADREGALAWVQAVGFSLIALFAVGAGGLWFWAVVQLAQLVLRAGPAVALQTFHQ